MKLNGYQIREGIRRWQLKRDAAANQFDGSLKRFDDETSKPMPTTIMGEFIQADQTIALLQVAQDIYNLDIKIEVRLVNGNIAQMTLSEGVKLLGGAGRAEKMWRSAANPSKDRYSSYSADDVRKNDETRAKPSMTVKEMLENADKHARYASALRSALALANAKESDIQLTGLEPSMLA